MTDSDADATRTEGHAASPAGAIGPYRLLQKLGEGGMGEVWLAEQTQPVHRQVAIKVVKVGMDTTQVVARFEAERQALAMMDHPTIAKIFDGGATAAGRPYFAMEYVRGESITTYCDRHQLATSDRLHLFIALCEGVQHAHQKGVIHRDIKPSNVLVTLQGDRPVPRIIDFGVAKAVAQPLTDHSLFTQLGMLIGTPEYMSPEQAEMTSLDVDTRSDVYALGVLLYELLVGALPFDRETFRRAGLDEMRRTIREQNVPRPSTRLTQLGKAAGTIAQDRCTDTHALVRRLRGDLDWIVLRALEKDRTRRYQTANALALDIQRHLNHDPVSAGPPSAVYRMGKFARRHRVGVSIAALLVVLLVAFAVSVAVQARRIAREAERANRAEKAALQEAATSKSVLAFLQNDLLAQASALTQANPNTKPDPNLTVRTALDRAARSVPDKFSGQPLVEASIRTTIGRTYRDLGLYPQAQEQLERALELRRRDLGENHQDTLDVILTLGDVYRVNGNYQLAEPLLTKALEYQRRVHGEEHPDTLGAMGNLGLVYRYQGKYAEAEALYTKELNARRRLQGEQHLDTLIVMNNLGNLYRIQGKYQQTEALTLKAIEAARKVLGAEHPLSIGLMNTLALSYTDQGKYTDAERVQRAVVDFNRRVLGDKHPNTLTSVSNLAEVYRYQGKYPQAESLFAEAVAGGREVQGEEHPNTLLTMKKLVELYADQGRYDQARALSAKVVEARRRLLGADHPDTLASLNSEAEVLQRQAMPAQAEPPFVAVLEARRRVLGPGHPETLNTMTSLGRVRFEQRRFADAEATLRDAVSGYEKNALDIWKRFRCEAILGAALLGQRNFADAEGHLVAGYQGMLRLRSTIPAHDQIELTSTASRLVQLYREWNKPNKAAEWQTKAGRRLQP